ncbi:hypothetical protein FH972_023865 [Carpinus fangiana]|uniref:Radical SAM core domain-containing protein n=1 Tax=Carpinus fangiana TaxID=176857 RepID=A0A5N6KWS3_9ROSI|nr:hypothetical protein FH972_023865 [Carpinus fangiana]
MAALQTQRHAARSLRLLANASRRAMSSVHDVDSSILSSGAPAPTPPTPGNTLEEAMQARAPRNNWTRDEIRSIYNTPLMDLSFHSATLHRRFHSPSAVQMCTLMNIKTGGCSEDCSYCAQSSRYNTGLKATKMSSVDSVLEAASIAKKNGSTRFCMGAAWRDMRGRKTSLKNVKAMVEGVRAMDMEVCVTLGMIDQAQAEELKTAGLTAYNHNVDTSREHYPTVITTRSYDERIATLNNVREAGINVCSGGILGLGEKPEDHAGANAIFTGEKMLTTDAVGWDEDKLMFAKYGLTPMKSFERGELRVEPEVPRVQATMREGARAVAPVAAA